MNLESKPQAVECGLLIVCNSTVGIMAVEWKNLRSKKPIGARAEQQRRAFLGSDISFVTTETAFCSANKTGRNVPLFE